MVDHGSHIDTGSFQLQLTTATYLYTLASIAMEQDKSEEACDYINEGLELPCAIFYNEERWLDIQAKACGEQYELAEGQ